MKISKQIVFKFRTFLEYLVKFCQYFFERLTRFYLINHNRTLSATRIRRYSLYQSNITVFFSYNLNTICSSIYQINSYKETVFFVYLILWQYKHLLSRMQNYISLFRVKYTIYSFIGWNKYLFWITSFAIFRSCSKVIFARRFIKIFLVFISVISYFFITSM